MDRSALRARVAVDRRALAAFRIALGGLLMADLLWRAPDLVAFYTDAGAFPRSTLWTTYPTFGRLSVHALSGVAWWQGLLFAAAGLAAIALVVGYRTRLATGVSLALLLSLHARNPVVLNSGDVLLRRLLFWGLLLPLGSRWALDATGSSGSAGEGGSDPGRSARVAGLATAGLLAQVLVVYLANLVVKLRGDAWPSGEALRYVLRLEQFTTPIGDALAGTGPLLAAADWAWLGMLACAPLLVVATGRRRTVVAGGFVAAHLGMALLLAIGLFPLVSIAALLPFLHGGVWDRIETVAVGSSSIGEGASVDPTGGRVVTGLAALGLVGILLVNGVALGAVAPPSGTPRPVEDRSWDMFAPSPPRATVWYTANATLETGRTVDALDHRPADAGTAPRRHASYRWRKFLTNARHTSPLRRSLAGFLCRRSGNDARIDRLRLVVHSYPVSPEGSRTVSRTTLGRYRCGRLTDLPAPTTDLTDPRGYPEAGSDNDRNNTISGMYNTGTRSTCVVCHRIPHHRTTGTRN